MKVPELLDRYTLQARFGPALIVCLPLGLGLAAWFPKTDMVSGLSLGAMLALAFGLLLAQLGRDAGKRAEPELFASWGGMPTTRLLSHEHSTLNRKTLEAIHQRLRALRPDLRIPIDLRAEKADPDGAMATYASCADYLRVRTRSASEFGLLFNENVNYGFRRNLWAMRRPGTATAVLGILSSTSALSFTLRADDSVSPAPVVYIVACALLLGWWLARIKDAWVRLAADAYARQLVESALQL